MDSINNKIDSIEPKTEEIIEQVNTKLTFSST